MGVMKRIVKTVSGLVAIGAIGAGTWIYVSPPELLKVGSGYTAKMVCSNLFLAGRNADEVLAVDVQAPGHPLLRLMQVSVDQENKRVHAALLGFIARNDAVYRDGLGCAVTPEGMPRQAVAVEWVTISKPDAAVLWPEGGKVEAGSKFATLLSNRDLVGPGMRAVVVVEGGRIVSEAYGSGFSSDTPLLGWSMTKTVNAAIIGTLVRDGKMSLETRRLFPQWQNDQRGDIRTADLLAMESGLAFNENYGAVADVTRMLYLENDMASFAADQPLEADPGAKFSYSSGTSVLLSKIWMNSFGNKGEALGYPATALFAPLGMSSATLEADAVGTFAGSSYMYATARDWARFGLFLARDGVWNGNRILPEGFVAQMREPSRASGGRYSKMQTWLPPQSDGLPADTFILNGHDGQRVTVIPSMDLVVVRLGLTPNALRFDMSRLVKEIVAMKRAG